MIAVKFVRSLQIFFYGLLLFSFAFCIHAGSIQDILPQSNKQFLPIDSAFSLFVDKADNSTIKVNWTISKGYYLYSEKMLITLNQSEKTATNYHTLLKSQPHRVIDDPYFGEQAIFDSSLELLLPIDQSWLAQNQTLSLQIHYQGCASEGLCYPPKKKVFQVHIQDQKLNHITEGEHTLNAVSDGTPKKVSHTPSAQQYSDPMSLLSGSLLKSLTTFFLLGLLLSFTPCVLPMIPILSSVLIGEKQLNTRKAFLLSFCYTLSLSIVLTLFGILAVLMGKNFQALFQQTWIILAFSGLFIYLGLTQLGWLKLSLPHTLHNKLHELQARFSAGSYLNAVVMGAFAILIASPCVSAPLVGALSYISQTGNILLGGSALFMLGMGMGTTLIIAGTLGGKYLPKAGNWMHVVNKVFAAILFALSIWLLSRVLPAWFSSTLWIGWCLIVAVMLGTFSNWQQAPKLVGVVFAMYACVLTIGLTQGQYSPLQPIRSLWAPPLAAQADNALQFKTIDSLENLERIIHTNTNDSPTLIKVTAEWCTVCQKNERTIFEQLPSQEKLKAGQWNLYKIDITQMTQPKEMLLKQLNIYGPPAMLFWDKTGNERIQNRIVGEAELSEFLSTLEIIES